MPTHAEQVLLGHLTDTESLDVLSREGFHQELSLLVIPSELVRKITEWAVKYYWDNGRKVGPSQEAIVDTWGDEMEALEITLGDPTEEIDSIEFAINRLRAQYAGMRSSVLQREIAAEIATASDPQKVDAVVSAARKFYVLAQSLQSRRNESEAFPGFEDSLMRHEDRKTNGHMTKGMLLGLPEIDEHIRGIHPGEMAVFGMTTGGGKSWLGARVALEEWRRGRRAVLWTLENDLEMSFDRLACILARVRYDKYQEGSADDGELIRIIEWTDRLRDSDCQPVVIQPDRGERDPISLVRKTLTLGADSMVLDQLSHVEGIPGSKARERNYQAAEILRALKDEIATGAEKLPLFMLAQINREGRNRMMRSGKPEFQDFALTSELENIVDFCWVGLQSEDNMALQRAVRHELKFRRGAPKNWLMRWRLEIGDIRVIGPAEEAS